MRLQGASSLRMTTMRITSQHIGSYLFIVIVLSVSTYAAEQATQRGVMVRPATIYISPDPASAKLAQIERGREVAIIEHSNQWLHVFATLAGQRTENPMVDEDSDIADVRDVSGWIVGKGVVTSSTPNGDKILFGAAADAESEASRRGGRKGAAGDAYFLYLRTEEYFPNSPLAGEALYRAADIKWQLDRVDVMSRPSSHARQAYLREGMNEDLMKKVIKKYPHTPWADRAAFHLLENKVCGDWQGASSCPKKEAEMYEKYARERPDSPDAAEALYDAAWRLAALIQIYKTEEKAKDSDQAKAHAIEVAQQIISKYPQSDWSDRAQNLLFLVQQDIPMYGNAVE
jgi:outer membrane protein assembly factor BamD (BamD/ComL family)